MFMRSGRGYSDAVYVTIQVQLLPCSGLILLRLEFSRS